MKKYIQNTLIFILFLSISTIGNAQDNHVNCGLTIENLDESMLKIIQSARADGWKSARKAGENFREVRIAIVVDSTVYFQYNKDTTKIKEAAYRNYRTASAYFERDFNVRFNVVAFEFLTKNKGYNEKNSTFGAFDKIRADYQNRPDIKRDILIVWSVALKEPYGGVANGIGTLGANAIIHMLSYGTNEPLMGTILHEIGHCMGSVHTQSCSWANGPFEVCTDVEGQCKNWAIDNRFASIMSYCTDGNLFFHPLCKDVIQNITNSRLQSMNAIPNNTPILHFPKNGVENFYPSDYFMWKSIEKINAYQIIISENGDFSNPLLDSLVADNMAYIGKTFKRNTTYFWRVRAQNQVGNGAWSSTSTFKTNQNLILKAPLLEKISPDKNYENQVISFKPVTYAKEYIIEFHKGSTITATSFHLEKKLTSLKNRLETLMPLNSQNINSIYVYRIRAISDTTKGEWSNTSEVIFYFQKANVDIGTLKTPTNTYISTLIGLPNVSQKRTYTYEVSKTLDFKTPEIKKTIQHDFYFQVPSTDLYATIPIENLSPNQLYYYRLKAKNEADSMNTWATGQFTTSYESRWKTIHSGNSVLPFGGSTKGIFIDKQNNKWIFGSQGVFKQSPDGKIEQFTRERTSDLLANSVYEMAEDEQGRIWFATSDGITKLENGLFTRYESFIWSAKDGLNKNVDRNMQNITFGKNETAYAYTSTKKLLRFLNNKWSIVPDNNTSVKELFRQDANGHLWVTGFDNANQKNTIRIFDGTNWSDFAPNWNFLKAVGGIRRLVNTDNEGSLWYQTNDSVFVVKDKNSYKAFSKNLTVLNEINNTTQLVDFRSFISPVYVTNTKTYFFNGNGQTYLEYDGSIYRYKFLPAVPKTANSYYKKMFAVDKNDKISFIQNSSAIHEFDRNNIIADFKEKQLYSGCSLKFRLGVFEPPIGDATTNKLKVMLSDGATTTFKEITASYSNGEIIAKIPTNTVIGKGYRFKFTMGDNWYISNESEPFEILIAPSPTIVGSNTICLGTSTTLIAKSDVGKAPYSYKWYDGINSVGDNKDNLSVNKAGDFKVEITDANGCIYNSANTKITEKGISPNISAIGQTAVYQPKTVVLNAKNAPDASYQWQKNGVDIIGEIKSNFEAKESGDYSVIIKSDGCEGISNVIKVLIEVLLGNELENEKIEIFPNPTTGQIYLIYTEIRNRKIEIIDSNGIILFEKTSKALKETLNLQAYATGVYFVQTKVGNQAVSKRVLKIDK